MTITLTDEERELLLRFVSQVTGPYCGPDVLRSVRVVQGLLRKLSPAKPTAAKKKKGK